MRRKLKDGLNQSCFISSVFNFYANNLCQVKIALSILGLYSSWFCPVRLFFDLDIATIHLLLCCDAGAFRRYI